LNSEDQLCVNRDEQLEQFRQSLLYASRVDDIDSFLTIYDARLDRNPPHCVGQYVEGGTLDSRLQQGGLRYTYVRDILLGLGRGLDAAHARQFIHLNIKPSNLHSPELRRSFSRFRRARTPSARRSCVRLLWLRHGGRATCAAFGGNHSRDCKPAVRRDGSSR
jgi:hypothetical protein